MNAHQAWQAACGQLQMDMNKASYETWVRAAELISFEGDIFTVGVPNAYARDWLESRLTGNVTRLLTGGIGRQVDCALCRLQRPGGTRSRWYRRSRE